MKWFDIADELLPPIYRAIKDMYAYAKAVNGELLSWVSYMERILNNFYIQNCDSSTLSYWEELLNIHTSGESNDARREKILTLLNNSTPTTESYVRGVIEKTFPGEEYHLWFDVENGNDYDLNIDIFTMDDSKINEFRNWFSKMCPAHLKQIVARAEKTSFDRELFVNCANLSSMFYSLGVVSFIEPPPPPPIEEFGEIIPVFFSTNGADSPRIDLRYADAPAYDEAGNPVYLEAGWRYESSETKWHSSRMTTSALATIYAFPNVSSPMANLSNKTAGSAVQIYTTDHVNALGAYLFRAKEPFYFAWLQPNGGSGTKNIAPGVSVPLYFKGSMSLMGYSDLSPLKLRAALGKTAEYLDISTLEIVQKDVYYAYLKNNGTEAVDVYCLIFSD